LNVRKGILLLRGGTDDQLGFVEDEEVAKP
jgi:hypothetical protein